MAKRKIALVVRVSDVKGREKASDRFISPELQIAEGSGYARGRGFAEFKVFEDLNISHTTPLDERPGMGEALRLVEAGKLAGIVVSSQDRLGPLEITRELKKRLLAAKAVLLVPDNPTVEVLDAKGYAALPGDLVAQIHTAQREEIGLRWAKAVTKAQARGAFVGPTPVGFDRLEDGRLRRNKDALAVEQAFRVRAAGGSWSETARVLESAGVRTSGTKAERWSTNSVRSLVGNRIYKGEHGPHHFEAYQVVPADVWAAAQSRPNPRNDEGKLERNGRQDGGRRLLGGLIFCGSCGHRMAPTATTKPNGTSYTYYQCKERTCGAKARAVAGEVETYVLRTFFRWVAHRPIPHAPDLTPLEAAVATAAESVKQWEEARDSGDFNPSDALRGLERARARHGQAEQALWHAREEAGLNDERLSLAQRWDEMSVEERRAALKRFEVKAIVQRGKESIDERVTIELRGSPVGPGWEPDLEYDDPSAEELARRIAAVHAINTDPDAAATAAAWDAQYADAKIIIKPLVLSEEDKALEEKTFGPLERALRKRERETKAAT